MTAYYNEHEPFAAQWLRNLISAGHIAPGHVDERSISDVKPDDLRGFTQCHFFAGIGVWSLALRRAGWPDGRRVWTASCPCQPFSAAGRGLGVADERHLWPHLFHLITQLRPSVVFGEQVASKDAEPWLDLVQADLEAVGFAVGAVAFPAAGIGAPHIRDRTYWVANASGTGLEGRERTRQRDDAQLAAVERSGEVCALAHPQRERVRPCRPGCVAGAGDDGMGAGPGPTAGLWRDADWIACRDDRWRPVEPGAFPLAHGAAARVGRLRAYGNAIVAPQAQIFIETVMECMP